MIMFELARVTGVRHIRDHVLWLRFSDGLAGEVDLSGEVHGFGGDVLGPLHDVALFEQVRVMGDTITWPNGADWAPETLHRLVAAANGAHPRPNDEGLASGGRQRVAVPEISRFFGIVISMYYDDHARPHFHAWNGDHSIAVEIDGDGVSGSFPPHRLPLVFEWRDAHRAELRDNWDRLRRGLPPAPVPPLG
jgi:hypothetical protein